MDKRRIAPTFMLPEDFPKPEVNDIYVVLRGGMHNVYITSAHEFCYKNYCCGQPFGDEKATTKVFRVDELSVLADQLLPELVERNNGVVDWTMALEQGQKAYDNLRDQIVGDRIGSMEAILRFSRVGRIYVPAENK